MADNLFEGTGVPRIKLPDGFEFDLPEPLGEDKESLRIHNFDKVVREEFRSEGDVQIEVGKKFLYHGIFVWSPMTKHHVLNLRKAENSSYFTWTPNKDLNNIKFDCRITLDVRPFAGQTGADSPGYTVTAEIIGIKYLAASGLGSLGTIGGYGGQGYGEQSGQAGVG